MLNCFADAIFSCTPYVTSSLNENHLYELMKSGINSIQRASFFMLTNLYKNFIPQIEFKKDEDMEMQALQGFANGDDSASVEELKDDQKDIIVETEIREKAEFKNIPPALI